ncbi:MAG: TetR/AcrR family transcriptional regulator [Tetrasphaera sp.]|jgi:AcrR family transcriptional regulator|nr:TetR/AcrR family transcriptional regulator [Tetrasphaera sp.]
MTQPSPAVAGRPRDTTIDACVLDAALSELGTKGYAAFSLAAVAEAAGTTRPAVYRRWKDKSALVVDAVARLAEAEAPPVTGRPQDDLVAELENFAHCIRAAGALPLAGLMLSDAVEPAVRAAYLERIVGPRRARLRGILLSAVEAGELAADADLEIAGSFFTGSWYALNVAGRPAPRDWAPRVAALVWAACGGVPGGTRADATPRRPER